MPPTDGQLLAEFTATHAEAPFEELIRRHGKMVLAVCRRVLGDAAEAEDAAQAVFLTLAQKAPQLHGRSSVAGWLHHVTRFVALRAREARDVRMQHEHQAGALRAAESGEAILCELKQVLDEELEALPESQRIPVLLRHLEGYAEADAAAALGWKLGTFSSRLSRGRERLRERLARRGVVVASGLLVSLLASAAEAAVPETLAATASKSAARVAAGHLAANSAVSTTALSLTKGAMQMLFLTKMKAAALALFAVLVLGGASGLGAYHALAEEAPTGTTTAETPNPGRPDQAPAADRMERIMGVAAKSVEARRNLGHEGALVARNAARLEDLKKQLEGVGWEGKWNELGEVDFTKQMVVCVFKYRPMVNPSVEKLFLYRAAGDAESYELDVTMSYVIQKGGAMPEFSWQALVAAVPKTQKLTVRVKTYHPLNGGPYPNPEKANLEWEHTFERTGGDVVDGLSAVVTPKAQKVKAGEDIQLAFKLTFFETNHTDRFAEKRASAFVWDGKYSNGYRNHAFLVESPDGKVHWLRPAIKESWDKNIPHPVKVTKDQPYLLPEWHEGRTLKSLKELGLDTSLPGPYRITGVYMQSGGETDDWTSRKKVEMWGGNIASNSVEVVVQ